MECAKLCISTQNVSGKIISLSCCFQHVTCVFAGSFSPIISDQCYLSSQAFHVLYSPYLSSLLHYQLSNSCLQPASNTHIQHPLLKFSDSTSPSHAAGQAWEAPTVNTLKAISSLLCSKSQPVMPTEVFTIDVLQPLPDKTVKVVFLHPSSSTATWKNILVCIGFISLRPLVSCVYHCYMNCYGKHCNLPRPRHATIIQRSSSVVASRVQSQSQEVLHQILLPARYSVGKGACCLIAHCLMLAQRFLVKLSACQHCLQGSQS